MKQSILIDGYNLIFQFPEIRKVMERDLESARYEMLLKLKSYAAYKRVKIVVVFDGGRSQSEQIPKMQGLQIIFSSAPEKADPLIKRLIEKKSDQISMVVSSDREIANYARLYGVKTGSSQSFAREMLTRPCLDVEQKFNDSLSEKEVEEWMALFRNRSNHENQENS